MLDINLRGIQYTLVLLPYDTVTTSQLMNFVPTKKLIVQKFDKVSRLIWELQVPNFFGIFLFFLLEIKKKKFAKKIRFCSVLVVMFLPQVLAETSYGKLYKTSSSHCWCKFGNFFQNNFSLLLCHPYLVKRGTNIFLRKLVQCRYQCSLIPRCA